MDTSATPPRWTARFQRHATGATIGRTDLLTYPAGTRSVHGGDCLIPWPDDLPIPPALAAERSPAFPDLNQVELVLGGEPEDDDDLIVVALAPDGRPHVCTPRDQPAGSLTLGRVTSAGWVRRYSSGPLPPTAYLPDGPIMFLPPDDGSAA